MVFLGEEKKGRSLKERSGVKKRFNSAKIWKKAWLKRDVSFLDAAVYPDSNLGALQQLAEFFGATFCEFSPEIHF